MGNRKPENTLLKDSLHPQFHLKPNTKKMKMIQFNNQTYFRVGHGQTPGSVIYHCGATSAMLEMFEAVVTMSGPHYSWVAVQGNRDLASVRVSQQTVQPSIGDQVIIGPLRYSGDTIKAETLHPLPKGGAGPQAPIPAPKPQPAPKPTFEVGEIHSVGKTGTYGFVVTENRESIFMPGSALSGVALVQGARVRFKRGRNDKGPIVLEAYAA